jgi:hypothetical protein
MEATAQLELRRVDAVAYEVLGDATRELELTPDERVTDIAEGKCSQQPHVCLLVE